MGKGGGGGGEDGSKLFLRLPVSALQVYKVNS